MKDAKDTQDNGKTVDERYSLSSDLSQLVNNPHLSDVVFVLEGRVRVFGHKILLAARSEMFRALLFGGMKESSQKEIILEDEKEKVFLQLMEYLYTGTTTLSESSVFDLFVAANKYGIETLLKKCGAYLSESLSSEKDVCLLLEVAHQYDERDLLEKCFAFIEQHTAAVISDPSFLSLPFELVANILESDELQAEEIDLFKAVIRWGEHQCQEEGNRSDFLKELILKIRFPCMSAEDLLDVVKPTELVPMEILFEAMAFRASPSRFDGLNDKKYLPRIFRKFRWDISTRSKELKVNDSCVTVWRPGSIGCFPSIRTEEIFSTGLVEIRIEDLPEKGNITSVGIATMKAFMQLRDGVLGNRVVGRVRESYGYVKLAQPPGDSYIFAEGVQVANPVDNYSAQDIIGIRVDSINRCVTFLKNGQKLAPGHPIAPGEYHIVVSLSNDAKITLL